MRCVEWPCCGEGAIGRWKVVWNVWIWNVINIDLLVSSELKCFGI